MTPEQKAWFEYGGAWRLVQRAIAQLNFDTKAASKETGLDYMILRKWNKGNYFLKDYIRDAWKKRAACRACSYSYRRMIKSLLEPRKAADAAGENTDVNPHNSLINAPAQVGETLADGKEKS